VRPSKAAVCHSKAARRVLGQQKEAQTKTVVSAKKCAFLLPPVSANGFGGKMAKKMSQIHIGTFSALFIKRSILAELFFK
jgi:hypothetical protein